MNFSNDLIMNITDPTSDQYSEVLNLEQIFCMSLISIITTTSGIAGTLKIEVSNDNVVDKTKVTNWVELTSLAATINAAGNSITNFEYVPWRFMRIKWDDSSSTDGTIKTYFAAKG